jgi:large subunit ribosomal protein L29
MKMVDIRSKKDEDLVAELRNLKDELFSLKFQHATSQLTNTGRLRTVKRDIAKVMTLMKERAIQVQADEKSEN